MIFANLEYLFFITSAHSIHRMVFYAQEENRAYHAGFYDPHVYECTEELEDISSACSFCLKNRNVCYDSAGTGTPSDDG